MDQGDVYDENENEVDELEQLKQHNLQEPTLRRETEYTA